MRLPGQSGQHDVTAPDGRKTDMTIRRAARADVARVARIYEEIHDEEEAGRACIGWVRGVYPTEATAQAALERGDLFVMEDAGRVVGAAIINQTQCAGYESAPWRYPAADAEVMVLHTLVVSPEAAGRGCGRAFAAFYEDYARERGCRYLRMDTNARNSRARTLYGKLGYREAGVIDTPFNGISRVPLVLLEKALAR